MRLTRMDAHCSAWIRISLDVSITLWFYFRKKIQDDWSTFPHNLPLRTSENPEQLLAPLLLDIWMVLWEMNLFMPAMNADISLIQPCPAEVLPISFDINVQPVWCHIQKLAWPIHNGLWLNYNYSHIRNYKEGTISSSVPQWASPTWEHLKESIRTT